eukprot:245665_1
MATSKSPKEVIPLLIEDNNDKKVKYSKFSKFIVLLFATLVVIGVCVIIVILLNKEDESLSIGTFGKFGMHGGNKKNQQISINSKITAQNIDSLQQICDFNATSSLFFSGYITVDDDEHAYFGGNAGYISCIDINSCSLIWKIKITDIVNTVDLPETASRNTLSLFQDKNGNKGILFGTPNEAGQMTNHKLFNYPCFAIALNIKDGSLMWKTIIANNSDSSQCQIHGFVIDRQYAFGGMSSFDYWFQPNPNVIFRGKVFKLNINNGQIIHEWYSTPIQQNREIDGYYSGAGIWPIHQIIDNYFVFGTGNLYNYPKRVQECLLGNTSSIPLTDARPYNPCGEDMSHILKWRCLEKDIHTDSLIILDKNTFEIKTGIPFAGVDAWGDYCFDIWLNNTNISFDTEPYCPKVPGRDTDAVAIATYHHNNIAYAALGDKSGRFYIIEIESGNVKVSKKVGPWAILGGISPFSMAIDEENMIAMATIRGNSDPTYKYKMGNGTIVCDGGSVHAIDLHTGHTIWQWINPYSRIEDENMQCNDTGYHDIILLDNTNVGMCERSFNGSSMLFANETVINVVIPPISDLLTPLNSIERAVNNGLVTISNGMVAIPTNTGEVFIHNITNGNHIKTLQCPDYRIETGNNTFVWNRQGIRSGITMFDDKLIYFCGVSKSEGAHGHVIVYQLNQGK